MRRPVVADADGVYPIAIPELPRFSDVCEEVRWNVQSRNVRRSLD